MLGPAYNLIPGHSGMKLVSQDYYVLDNHTVEENIRDRLSGYADDYKEARANVLLKLLDLSPLRQSRAKHLSSGQKQRVAIARALAEFPQLLLLDEPFNNLDKILKDKLFDFITKEARKKKSAVLLVTHQAEEALKFAGKVGIVMDGKLAQFGPTLDVYYEPANAKIAKLMGDYNVLPASDFEAGTSYRKKKKKIMLRPDQLKITGTKKGCDLVVNYSAHFFNGKCFEVLAHTRSGADLIFYVAEISKILDEFFLKINRK